MNKAVIVDAVRTPGGKRNGVISGWHPADLAAVTLQALIERTGVDPALIEDVIMGCGNQVGAQGGNIGRFAVLAAGFPETVVSTTIDRQCGSSQQALHFAAQGIMAGAYDVVIAAGVEVMSMIPMGASFRDRSLGRPVSDAVKARYAEAGGLVSQGVSAELIATKWGLTREDLDSYSVESHRRAATATEAGRFANELVPVESRRRDPESGEVTVVGGMVERDEGIRDGSSVETLAKLRPVFDPEGVVTAGNSSQITDGASAVLMMSEERAHQLGITPRASFTAFGLAGVDPLTMLTGPIPATEQVLARSGLTMSDIDLFEVNEAFASVVLAWARTLDADLDRVNVNGGAIALGHPLGASGTKLMATLLNELERRDGRYGLQVMCEGGGMANALVIERLS